MPLLFIGVFLVTWRISWCANGTSLFCRGNIRRILFSPKLSFLIGHWRSSVALPGKHCKVSFFFSLDLSLFVFFPFSPLTYPTALFARQHITWGLYIMLPRISLNALGLLCGPSWAVWQMCWMLQNQCVLYGPLVSCSHAGAACRWGLLGPRVCQTAMGELLRFLQHINHLGFFTLLYL